MKVESGVQKHNISLIRAEISRVTNLLNAARAKLEAEISKLKELDVGNERQAVRIVEKMTEKSLI
jgi:hypothetical protein